MRISRLLVAGALVLGVLTVGAGRADAAPTGGDVAASKTCPTAVNPGQVYNCTITLTATTATAGTNVEVTDQSTAGAKFFSVFGSGGATCTAPAVGSEGNSIKCTFPTISQAAPQTMTVAFFAASAAPCKSRITNTATVNDLPTGDTNDVSSFVTDVECDRPAPGTPSCTISADPGATSGVVLRGTEGPDVICGSPFGDSIYGLGGDDIIFGGGGGDYILGGAGNDTIHGGTGSDSIDGQAGDDTMYGEDGDDYLNGGTGFDTGSGGAGNDACTTSVEVCSDSTTPVVT